MHNDIAIKRATSEGRQNKQIREGNNQSEANYQAKRLDCIIYQYQSWEP